MAHVLAIVMLCLLHASSFRSDSVGVVYIGLEEGAEENLVYNENYNQMLSSQQMSAFIRLYNDTSGSLVSDYNSAITISCSMGELTAGYSYAVFDDVVHARMSSLKPASFVVPMRIIQVGRPKDVRCWGVSRVPAGTTTQFTKENSLSPPRQLTITKFGTVNICNDMIIAPDIRSTTRGMFFIELSEAVVGGPITVTCHQSSTGVAGFMQMRFGELKMYEGDQRSQLFYTLVSYGSPVSVYCRAQSVPTTKPQFINGTSEGSRATAMVDSGSIQLLPEANINNRRGTQIKAFLFVDKRRQGELVAVCSVTRIANLQQANDIINSKICEQPSSSSPSNQFFGDIATTADPLYVSPPETNQTGQWFLTSGGSDPNVALSASIAVKFQISNAYHWLQLNRNDRLLRQSPELVVLRCCISNSRVYGNQSVGVVFSVDVNDGRQVEWDVATVDSADPLKETKIVNPGYVEVSPCPCDLTMNSCDINCCCDKDCDDAERAQFSMCVSGVHGGNVVKLIPQNHCRSTYPLQPDMFPLLCVLRENTGFLGYFRFPKPMLPTKQAMDLVVTQYGAPYSTRREEQPKISPTPSDYHHGSVLQTGRQTQLEGVATSSVYRLTLPRPSLSDRCIDAAPIVFLQDYSATCERLMRDCTTDPRLNALSYAHATSWSHPPCARGLLLLQRAGVNELRHVADVRIRYVCEPASVPTHQSQSASNDIIYDTDSCHFDNITSAYVCDAANESTAKILTPARLCDWDDSYVRPPTPSFNLTTGICSNAVVSAQYNFTWAGTTIVSLDAVVELADINIQVEPLIQQQFSVRFLRKSKVSNSMQQEYSRSGNPGYEADRPVISGISVYNDNGTFDHIDTNETRRLSLWKQDANGLCREAGHLPLLFNQNVRTSCSMRFGLSELENCDSLRKFVLSQQDRIMSSNYISLVGDPNRTQLSVNWTKIIRQDLLSIIDGQRNETWNGTEAEDGDENVNVTTPGMCDNIPSGIHVDVMYAAAGKSNNKQFYQIVGARISYTLTTWRLRCVGLASCRVAANQTSQTFLVSSTANFIQVPSEPERRYTKYQLSRMQRLPVCHGEACWEELFYPLKRVFPADPHLYTVGFSIVISVFAIGFIMLIEPWWWKIIRKKL